jgi:hypothetical protein
MLRVLLLLVFLAFSAYPQSSGSGAISFDFSVPSSREPVYTENSVTIHIDQTVASEIRWTYVSAKWYSLVPSTKVHCVRGMCRLRTRDRALIPAGNIVWTPFVPLGDHKLENVVALAPDGTRIPTVVD